MGRQDGKLEVSVAPGIVPQSQVIVRFSGEPRGSDYEAWREDILRRIGIDPEPSSKERFDCRTAYTSIAGLTALDGESGTARFHLATSQNDDLALSFPLAGVAEVTVAGKAVTLRPGEMVFVQRSSAGHVQVGRETKRVLTLIMPRNDLLALCPRAEDLLATRIDHSPSVRQTISGYMKLVTEIGHTLDAVAQKRLAQHTLEMIAVLLDRNSSTTDRAEALPSAVRFELIKSDILRCLGDPALSIGLVAERHRCHPKQVQRMFAASGRTFADFVLEQRLLLARRRLLRNAGVEKIASIAFDVGFNDLSYFNRAFRERFGMTPSEWRAEAL